MDEMKKTRLLGPDRPPLSPSLPRPRLRNEVLLLLGVSLGSSAAYSIVALIAKLTAPLPLAQQTTAINTSQAPGRPWLDLTYQLMGIFFTVVPAGFAIHLLNRDGPGAARTQLGLDRRWSDLGTGSALAIAVGLPGLGLYALALQLGVNTYVDASSLPHIWWAIPVLVLAAVGYGVLEETVVVCYLVTRLLQLDWRKWYAIGASAVLRGSYHLYQGFGAFVGNTLMGIIFGAFYVRTRRILPLIVAHSLLDIGAFVGYELLLRADFELVR